MCFLQLWEDAVRATSFDVARIQAALSGVKAAVPSLPEPTFADSSSVSGSVLSHISLNTSSDFGSMRNHLVLGVAKVRQRLRDSMASALRKVQEKVCHRLRAAINHHCFMCFVYVVLSLCAV